MPIFDLSTFSAAQAAKITGVSLALQRDWRRRDILPPLATAQAAFNPFDLGRLMALGTLSNQGLSPLLYKGIAGKIGAAIVFQAVLSRQAYTGAFEDYYPSDIARLQEHQAMTKRLRFEPSVESLEEEIDGWRRYSLAKYVTGSNGYDVSKCGAFVIFADGSFDFYQGPIEPFEVIERNDPRMLGAIVVIDLSALGEEMLRRSGPLVHINEEVVAQLSQVHGVRKVTQYVESLRAEIGGKRSAGDRDHAA